MAIPQFTWVSVLIRFIGALALVFLTYNPAGYSYIHWAIMPLPSFSPMKALAGAALLIGWTMYLRATMRSLGAFGLILAIAFFGSILWLVVDWGLVPANSVEAISYLILFLGSAVLTAGMSWSHIRRRIAGQLDVDELEER